jgi:hypothetical protein
MTIREQIYEILDDNSLVVTEVLAEKAISELTQAIEEVVLEQKPPPPRTANELYPQDYVDGYTQSTEDFEANLKRVLRSKE